jgi:SPP1 gp7 family putative phage head morphogenesis protein
LNANEKLIDSITDHLVDLTRVETRLKGHVLGIISDLESELVKAINQANVLGVSKSRYQQLRLKKLLEVVRGSIKASYGDIDKYMKDQQKKIAELEYNYSEKSINQAIGTDFVDINLDNNTLTALAKQTLIQGAPSAEWWGRQSSDLQQKFTDQVRRGILQGETNSQIIQRIRGTRARGYSDGIMNVARNQAGALVNTSVHAVANASRMEAYKDQEDIAKGYRFISTLDNRTSTTCKARSDLLWTLDGKPVGHHIRFERPPVHFNCRSTLSLVLKSWDEISGKVKTELKDDLTPRQRAAMGGPAKVANYEDWLKRQSEEKQIDILGQKKWNLWQTGKLSFRDLVDQKGNPLTIEQLEKKIGASAVKKDKTVKKEPPKQKKQDIVFNPAKTKQEAEQFSTDVLKITPLYEKMDLGIINSLNESIANHLNDFPLLKGQIKYTGVSQAVFKKYKDKRVKELTARYLDLGYTKDMAEKYAKKMAKAPKASSNAYAYSWGAKDFESVTIPRPRSKKYTESIASLKTDVENNFHPPGTGNYKAVIDHEMGHQLDDLLGISKEYRRNKELSDALNKYGAESVSRYALTNYDELTAEAWAEYRNNDKPRALSKIIGEFIEKRYKEYEKSQ